MHLNEILKKRKKKSSYILPDCHTHLVPRTTVYDESLVTADTTGGTREQNVKQTVVNVNTPSLLQWITGPMEFIYI